ncbi:MAG: TatD family hydrolase [Betaproteobacteria bacterium]|nr:TatD family hydrolase [Betaproteobacteria bacterium]
MITETYSLVDSHCHPHFPPLGENISVVRTAMSENHVAVALAVATCGGEWARVKSLAQEYPGVFYAAVGVHPLAGEEADDEQTLAKACAAPEVLAVGETGLDFFRGGETEAMQRRRFAAHIAAARRLKKPLIIHMRNSQAAVFDMLRAENARDVGGVLHCFTGEPEDAHAARDINFIVSFSGIITYKKSEPLRQTAAAIPADGYLVETDAPYLTPAPHRGKTNTPAYVRYVAEAVAAARKETVAQTAAQTAKNFARVFAPPATPAKNYGAK